MLIQPPACLILGPTGAGKTSALATFALKGLEVFVFVTEPTGVDSLYDSWKRTGADINLLHYCVVSPASPGWKSLRDMGTMINAMSYKDLSEMKQGIGKSEMKQYFKFLSNCENFQCDRTGKAFGDITEWDDSRVVAFDSLSGLSTIHMQNTVGFKPSPHQGEWGIAMSSIDNFLLKVSSDIKSYFVLTAHIEKEPDEITGMTKVMVSTLGRKLAPKIPKYFSEVIRARKDGAGKFFWATIDSEADLKNRALTSSNTLSQDFGPIVDAHRARIAAATASTKADSAPGAVG